MRIKQISRSELQRWQEEGISFQLIDVREASEHTDHNIGGILIPLSELNAHLHKINTEGRVVFYCRKGIRSQIAIQRLQSKYPGAEFFNLQTGIGSNKDL